MTGQVLEGTWEEIIGHAPELAGRRVRLMILPDKERKPNEGMLQVIRSVAEDQKDMRFTSGEDTQRLLREAREGAMFNYDPDEES
jgi:hypothetical protein